MASEGLEYLDPLEIFTSMLMLAIELVMTWAQCQFQKSLECVMQYMNMCLSSLSIYYIFNKIEQIYHGESVQPFNKHGPVATNIWIHYN